MDTLNISTDDILRQLRAIATTEVTDVVQVVDGDLVVRPTHMLTPEMKMAVCSIEKSAGCLKVKFYDKLKALELLGKCMGLFERQYGAQADNGLLDTIEKSTKEALNTHDISEVQQTAAACHDMVEQD